MLHIAEVGPVFVLGAIASFSEHVHLSEFKTEELMAEQERLTATPLTVDPDELVNPPAPNHPDSK
jgi:hypothetical protein